MGRLSTLSHKSFSYEVETSTKKYLSYAIMGGGGEQEWGKRAISKKEKQNLQMVGWVRIDPLVLIAYSAFSMCPAMLRT